MTTYDQILPEKSDDGLNYSQITQKYFCSLHFIGMNVIKNIAKASNNINNDNNSANNDSFFC